MIDDFTQPMESSDIKRTALMDLTFQTGNLHQLFAVIDSKLANAGDRQLCQTRSHKTRSQQTRSHQKKSNLNVGFINPHVFNMACEHDTVYEYLHSADLLCIDGIGTKLAILLTRGQLMPRVVAEHLFNFLVSTHGLDTPALLVGTSTDEVNAASTQINIHSNGMHIVDTLSGFESDATYKQHFDKHSDIPLVLIGAGSPQSERIARIANSHCVSAVIFHIGGGTIKTWAGTKKRGPAMMSAIGLEWLHRLVFEPHTRQRYTSGGCLYLKNLTARRFARNSAHKGNLP